MENNFSLASSTIQGWVSKQAVLFKICVKPFQKFDFDLLKLEYHQFLLKRFPTVEQLFLEDADGVIWYLTDREKGEWASDREDSWYEENGIFIGDLGYAEIKLYGTGLQFSKQPKVID